MGTTAGGLGVPVAVADADVVGVGVVQVLVGVGVEVGAVVSLDVAVGETVGLTEGGGGVGVELTQTGMTGAVGGTLGVWW